MLFPTLTLSCMCKSVSLTKRPNGSGAVYGLPQLLVFWAICILLFQKNQAQGLAARYHFTFHGGEHVEATVVIANKTLMVEYGHVGQADLHLTADSTTWLKFLRRETGLLGALLRRKIKMKGNPKLLLAFGRCFPS